MLAHQIAEAVAAKLRSTAPLGPRLLTVEQASRYIGRSKHAVEHMVSAGRLPVVRDGRRVLLDVRDLDGWIEDRKEGSR